MTKPKSKALPPAVADDLADLLAEYVPPPLEEGDITIQRVIEKNVSYRKANKIIKELEAKGKIKRIGKRRSKNGNIVDAWRRA